MAVISFNFDAWTQEAIELDQFISLMSLIKELVPQEPEDRFIC